MAYLILVRHGKSEWNLLGRWTGHTDVGLVEKGIEEAREAGSMIRDIDIHEAHVSLLKRAQQTFHEIRTTLGRHDLEAATHASLNERHYGVHTGKNKWEVRDEIGEEAFQSIRRGWDVPIEGGETLKDVYDRVVPYYKESIHPQLRDDKNVIVVAHGNSLRALAKHLENISDDDICELEIGTGEVYCYQFDQEGNVVSKEIRAVNADKARM